MLSWLTPDGRRILLARGLRTFAYGYLAVILGAYLDRLGMSPFEIGLLLTAAIAGSAAMTVVWSLLADRVGRRRTVANAARSEPSRSAATHRIQPAPPRSVPRSPGTHAEFGGDL